MTKGQIALMQRRFFAEDRLTHGRCQRACGQATPSGRACQSKPQ
jgi:hypothetical protein